MTNIRYRRGHPVSTASNVRYWHMIPFTATHQFGRDWTTTDKGRPGRWIGTQ